MRKTSFIYAAIAACTLSACDKQTTINVNQGEEISFLSRTGMIPKGTMQPVLEDFGVNAFISGSSNSYFSDARFYLGTDETTYRSEKPYYWPLENSLDFYAYAPYESDNIVKDAFNKFTVTPSAAATDDLIFAITTGQNKASNGNGVSLNFLHTMSRIIIKVKNSQTNLRFTIDDFKLAHIEKEGVLTLSNTETTVSGDLIDRDDWAVSGTPDANDNYIQTFSSSMTIEPSANTIKLGEPMILVPQETMKASAYKADKNLNGAYIAFKGKIFNAEDNTQLFPQGENSEYIVFPADFDFEPGMQYTYIVDLCGGGYFENGTEGTDNEPLKPILTDNEIKFVGVVVDQWNNIDR